MTVPKKTGKRFTKGRSGNPAGRPAGSPDRRALWRERLGVDLDRVLDVLVKQAIAGDLAAIALIMQRTCSPLRPSREPVQLPDFNVEGTPTATAQGLIRAAMRGELASDAAAELVSALASVAKLREVEELEARIAALESVAAQH